VLNKSGDWIDVPNIPGTFVVNIGQAFEVVTNGVCKATTHRVVGGSLERFSVPFFQGVRRNLTKEEAVGTLKEHFLGEEFKKEIPIEAEEGEEIDSAFLKGKYETWGESQLRTKIRSHRDVGRRFYGDVFEKYVNDD
jgi:isopenicillin N synthase-like dioxygenase